MSNSDQQKMCLMESTILSCAIPWGFETQDYKLRRLIFPHIKANKSYEKQIGLIKQYYDDEWINLFFVGHRFAWHIRVLSLFFAKQCVKFPAL